ncbi:MAG: ATP-binding cassette domain-containing protein, partial [Saprospiraceae bacterium]|nr:ATP-binding cassette domain-containing protein [Saprospiraceae bacterium]
MLQVNDIYVKYGDRILLDHITFLINREDKIALVGRNGVGKSTLFQVISGRMRGDGGEISCQKGTDIGYLEQTLTIDCSQTIRDEVKKAFANIQDLERENQMLEKNIASYEDYEDPAYISLLEKFNLNLERLHHLGAAQMDKEIEQVILGLGFSADEIDNRIDTLSGGWQMRVQLAQLLLMKPHLLLLDEPTNHLDIEAIIWLENYIRNYAGAIILISHDKTFLRNTVDRIIELENGSATDYVCGFDRYLLLKQERYDQLEAAFKNQQKTIAQKERTIKRFMAKASKTSMAQSMQKQLDKMDRIILPSVSEAKFTIRFLPVPRSSRTVVKGKRLDKSFDSNHVLHGIDLEIERGDRVAIVGQNGQGKTTLVKILMGEINTDSGELEFGSNLEVGYYAQNQSDFLEEDLTVLEMMENAASEEMRSKVRSILGAFMFSGEDVEKRIKVLSGGERARLAFAHLLLRPINFLVLDEPTNHLDMEAKEVLKQALRSYDGSLLVV